MMIDTVPSTILSQLGGTRFVVMTGSKNFLQDGNTLRMHLCKNRSKANRLTITLDADDTYTMRFYQYTQPRLNHKTFTFTDEKVVEIKTFNGVYCDQLQELFTIVTGLETHM